VEPVTIPDQAGIDPIFASFRATPGLRRAIPAALCRETFIQFGFPDSQKIRAILLLPFRFELLFELFDKSLYVL
jgi:hypothetical protein